MSKGMSLGAALRLEAEKATRAGRRGGRESSVVRDGNRRGSSGYGHNNNISNNNYGGESMLGKRKGGDIGGAKGKDFRRDDIENRMNYSNTQNHINNNNMNNLKNNNDNMQIAGGAAESSFGETFWRDCYYKLRDLQDDDVQDLEQELLLSRQREAKLQGIVALVEQAGGLTGAADTLRAAAGKDEEVERLRGIIKFYESLTGMNVKSSDENKYTCTIKNSNTRSVVRFDIETSSDSIVFTPRANLELFPEHLQGRVQCDTSMGPELLADVISELAEDR